MEALFLFFIFAAFITVAGAAFVFWVTYGSIRALARLLGGGGRSPPRRVLSLEKEQVCENGRCGMNNPAHARFCRRCGKSLPTLLRVVADRVAM